MPEKPVHFDDYAHKYDETVHAAIRATGEDKDFFAEGRIRHLVKVLSDLHFGPVTRVLDYGCGVGTAAPYVHAAWPSAELVGVDVSARSVELAQQERAAERTSFHALGTAAANAVTNVDIAFAAAVFHHIPPSERPGALAYIHERLRPGGLFAMFEHNPLNPGTQYIMKTCEFDRDAVKVWPKEAAALMDAAGFALLRTDFLFFFPRFLRVFRPLEPALKSIPLGGQFMCLGRKT